MSAEYFLPSPLPEDFSRTVALRCADLVNIAYSLYQQWSDAGKPDKDQMEFRPVAYGDFVFSAPFWRRLIYRKSLHRGPRRTFRRYRSITELTPAGVCAQSGNILYIVFRGTLSGGEKIKNWMARKQDAIFDDLENGRVHRGFHQCYESVRPAIRDFLEMNAGKDKTIRVTGHSLGGALASLVAMDIASGGLPYRALEAFTFASPRVGSIKWSNHYATKSIATWRIANQKDPVTKVPPKSIGYLHVGTPVYFAALSGLAAHSLDNAYLPALRLKA